MGIYLICFLIYLKCQTGLNFFKYKCFPLVKFFLLEKDQKKRGGIRNNKVFALFYLSQKYEYAEVYLKSIKSVLTL